MWKLLVYKCSRIHCPVLARLPSLMGTTALGAHCSIPGAVLRTSMPSAWGRRTTAPILAGLESGPFVSELLVLSIQHSFLHSTNIFCGSTVCQALCWALELIGHTVITPISQKGKLRLRGVPSPVQEGGRQGLSGPCSVTRMPPLRACSFPSLLSTWGLCTPRGCSGLSLSLGTCLPPQPVDLTRLGLRAG